MRSHFGATLAVLVGFVAHQQMSTRIAAHEAVDPATIARFHAIDWEIDGWRSRSLPVDPELKQLLGADVAVHRAYTNGMYTLDAWVNYYASDAAHGSKHSPEVCLSLGGWRLVGHRQTERGTDVALSVERFTKEGTDLLVASTFLLGGRTYATQPEAKLALARRGGTLAFAMASATLPPGAPETHEPVVELLKRLARRVQDALLERSPSTQNGSYAD